MGVILGCYTSEELKDKIVSLRRDDPEFEHLQIPTRGYVYNTLPPNNKRDRDLTLHFSSHRFALLQVWLPLP